MAKKSSKQKKISDKEMDAEIRAAMNTPWLKMRTGIIVMAIASVGIAIFMAWQIYVGGETLIKSIGWGLIFGVAMWAIFGLGLWFNRFMRRGQNQ